MTERVTRQNLAWRVIDGGILDTQTLKPEQDKFVDDVMNRIEDLTPLQVIDSSTAKGEIQSTTGENVITKIVFIGPKRLPMICNVSYSSQDNKSVIGRVVDFFRRDKDEQ
jgi:hypothetical protein